MLYLSFSVNGIVFEGLEVLFGQFAVLTFLMFGCHFEILDGAVHIRVSAPAFFQHPGGKVSTDEIALLRCGIEAFESAFEIAFIANDFAKPHQTVGISDCGALLCGAKQESQLHIIVVVFPALG